MPPAVVAQAHARPYRDFLTPVLHKRLANTFIYTLFVCWLIAIWQGPWNHYVWSWSPIGPIGVRLLLLFIASLIIYMLRIAQYHVGARNTEAGWETFQRYAFTTATVTTVTCYLLSAFLYAEIYIWSQPEKKKLGYTDQGRNYERLRLNERPMFLRYMFALLAVAHSTAHLWYDHNRIDFTPVKLRQNQDAAAAAPRPPHPLQVLGSRLGPIAKTAAILSAVVAVVGSLVYLLGFRYTLWAPYYSVARNLVSLSKSRPAPVTLSPFGPLFLMFLVESTLLSFLWQFVNTTFDLYMSQAPIKNEKPITNDSKDPNGSLLNGLKVKKMTVQAVAFWELALITDSFPERRQSIYKELHRKNATTLKQVVDICLAEVNFLIVRLSKGLDPHFHPEAQKEKAEQTQAVSLVPQIAPPIRDAAIKGPGISPTTTRGKLEDVAADIAKSLSSPQNTQKTREYLQKGVAESSQYLKKGAEEVEARTSGLLATVIASPLGYPFRSSLRRTASVVVTGAPYSRLSILCNAITALTNIVIHSIREDEFGRLQREVPTIIRVFTQAIKKLDVYVAKLEVHWTDMDTLAKPEAERKNIEEVQEVRECLRSGLAAIIHKFGEYFSSLGLSRAEVSEAKRAASNGPEMAVVR